MYVCGYARKCPLSLLSIESPSDLVQTISTSVVCPHCGRVRAIAQKFPQMKAIHIDISMYRMVGYTVCIHMYGKVDVGVVFVVSIVISSSAHSQPDLIKHYDIVRCVGWWSRFEWIPRELPTKSPPGSSARLWFPHSILSLRPKRPPCTLFSSHLRR